MRKIPFSPPDISEAEIYEVAEALKSGWITTGGRTKQFEKELAQYIGNKKVACLNSDTAALEMTLRILGIGQGDEVITTAYTYTASAAVIEHVGAKIVMLDVATDSFEIDYEKIADAITERTKAIIPVDIGGRLCDYDKIFEAVNSRKNLFVAENDLQNLYGRVVVISDSAHGLGAYRMVNNEKILSGRFADFTCFSFHAVKNLTTGEGGAVTWRQREGLDDEWLYKQYMLFSLHGQSKDAFSKNQLGAWEYNVIFPGYKCNMTDIMAAIGLKQLERYPGMLQKRRHIIEEYDRELCLLGVDRLIHYEAEMASSGHLYLMRLPGADAEARNRFITKLAEAGIAANVHYKPLPLLTAYHNLGFDIAEYPNAFHQYENEVSLPLHTCLSEEDVAYVCDTVKKNLKEM